MAQLTSKQLEKLQNLSNINLDTSMQQDFLQKLEPVVAKLEELWAVDTKDIVSGLDYTNTLRTLEETFQWDKQKDISDGIMENIEHEVVNNSIVIKSVLS